MHVDRRKSEFTSALTTRLTEQLIFQSPLLFIFVEYTSTYEDTSQVNICTNCCTNKNISIMPHCPLTFLTILAANSDNFPNVTYQFFLTHGNRICVVQSEKKLTAF
jgi:hypothetical protein